MSQEDSCLIETASAYDFLPSIKEGAADLVLTDPPYSISRETGFSKGAGENTVERFKKINMDFGEWDKHEIDLEKIALLIFKCLRSGGTAIIFYDLFKITPLISALNVAGFKRMRLIEWVKTNPVPINSQTFYLNNTREIAICCVKDNNPVFNSSFDGGRYFYPTGSGKLHPTQKPLKLFEDLIVKHSNTDDLVLDPFLGSGTTALAALNNERRFAGCDINHEYVEVANKRVRLIKNQTRLEF